MRVTNRKLILRRESLRLLGDKQRARVRGGTGSYWGCEQSEECGASRDLECNSHVCGEAAPSRFCPPK